QNLIGRPTVAELSAVWRSLGKLTEIGHSPPPTSGSEITRSLGQLRLGPSSSASGGGPAPATVGYGAVQSQVAAPKIRRAERQFLRSALPVRVPGQARAGLCRN